MSDQGFHEIQLSGKQLFFLFMCAVIVAAVIFLFGVSVGREVSNAPPQNAQGAPGTDTPPAANPPPTQTAPNELSYAQALQAGTPDPAKVVPPTPPAEEPTPPSNRSSLPPAVTPAKTASTAPAAKADPSPPGADATGDFSLQVGAFSTEAAATNVAGILKGKGYPTQLVTLPENMPIRYRVYVGPYRSRTEAQRTQTRLEKEGYKSLIKH
jgi:cell division protein FtsN